MNDPLKPGDLDRELGRWLREESGTSAPPRLVEDVFARTSRTKQQSRGRLGSLARGRWPIPGGPGKLLVVGFLAILGGAVGGTLVGSSPPDPRSASRSPMPTTSPGPLPLKTLRAHSVCPRPAPVIVVPMTDDQSSIWVVCPDHAVEVTPGTNTAIERPGLGMIASDHLEQWAIKGDSIVRLRADRSIAATAQIGSPSAVAVVGTTAWALDPRMGVVSSDGITAPRIRLTPSAADRPIALMAAGGSLWLLNQGAGELLRLDPRDGGLIATIPVDGVPTGLISAAGALFVTSPSTSTLTRIDLVEGTPSVLTLDLGPDGQLEAIGGSPTELILASRTSIHRVEPLTGRLGPGFLSPGYPTAVAALGTTWLIGTETGELIEARAP